MIYIHKSDNFSVFWLKIVSTILSSISKTICRRCQRKFIGRIFLQKRGNAQRQKRKNMVVSHTLKIKIIFFLECFCSKLNDIQCQPSMTFWVKYISWRSIISYSHFGYQENISIYITGKSTLPKMLGAFHKLCHHKIIFFIR